MCVLWSTLLFMVNAGTFMITGFNDELNFITDVDECAYPNSC